MSVLVHRRFRMPSGCSCKEIIIRETNGIDEQQAALRADARGERTNIYAELVRASVVEVDGVKVTQPYLEVEQWNSKTRALLRQAFDSLNELPEAEVADFLAQGEDATPGITKEKEE